MKKKIMLFLLAVFLGFALLISAICFFVPKKNQNSRENPTEQQKTEDTAEQTEKEKREKYHFTNLEYIYYINSENETDFEEQAADPDAKIMILCSPHNPVGRVWTKEELARVGEICKKNNVLVIADEIHSDLVYAGYVHTPFALASDAPHLVCTSLGKTFNVAGLRLANIFSSSAELKKQYDQEIDAYSYSASNTFGLEMVQAAYSPEGEAWLEELLVYLQGNVEVVSEWCQKHNVGFTAPQGTFLCWLDLASAGLTDEEIIKKIIMGKEVICVPGPWFGKGGEGYLRLNIGCTRKTLVEALDRIASVLDN